MKKIIILALFAFSFAFAKAQTPTSVGGVGYSAGVPSFTPATTGYFFWVNTATGKAYFYNGTSWVDAGGTYLPLSGGTLTGHLLLTDNTYDIGASGATRPRTGYFGTSVVAPILVSTSDIQVGKTIITGGTTGAQTINKTSGTVNFAAAATSLVVTNSLVTTNSIIICTIGTNDATMTSVQAVAGSGSFTIYANTPPTAETRVNFLVTN